MHFKKSAVAVLSFSLLSACTGDILGKSRPVAVAEPGQPGAPEPAQPDPTEAAAPRCSQTPQGCGGLTAPRVRRLTASEYQASVTALLGVPPANSLPPDARQSGFTRNDAQVVDTVWATAAQSSAETLAAQAVARIGTLAPCATGVAALTCAGAFIDDFASRAFRRPLSADERTGLTAIYQQGTDYPTGIALVVRTVLQAPGFLYLTELTGDDWELAAQLSYLFTGGPPDDALRAAAAAGQLKDGATREAQARRLLSNRQLQGLVIEWLGLDRLQQQSKIPAGPALDEARALSDDALLTRRGGVKQLLGGILTQRAFLAAYANVADSGPIHRGAAIIRKVLCQTLPDPSDVGLTVTPPAPDPTLTTRERFSAHVSDAQCRACHQRIDPAGFAFEHFDAAGAYRDTDHGKPVDSSGAFTFDGRNVAFGDHVGFTQALAASGDAERCFQRTVYRFANAQASAAGELAFLDRALDVPEGKRGDPIELLVAYAGSEQFAKRVAP